LFSRRSKGTIESESSVVYPINYHALSSFDQRFILAFTVFVSVAIKQKST